MKHVMVALIAIFLSAASFAYVSGETVIDVGAEFAGNMRSAEPAVEWTIANGSTISLGTCMYNQSTRAHDNSGSAGFNRRSVAFTGGDAVGFDYDNGQYTFITVNANAGDLTGGGYITVAGEALHPDEILIHPCSDYRNLYISCTAPSNGYYRILMQVRDLDGNGTGAFLGVQASIRINPQLNCIGACFCGAEPDCDFGAIQSNAIDIPCVYLTAGQLVAFAIDNHGAYGFDATAMNAKLIAAARQWRRECRFRRTG